VFVYDGNYIIPYLPSIVVISQSSSSYNRDPTFKFGAPGGTVG